MERNPNLYEEVKEHYEELQTKVFSDEEALTHYEVCLKNRLSEPHNSEENIVESELILSEDADVLEEKSLEEMYELKTINRGCVNDGCTHHKVITYYFSLGQLIDFIRGTIFVAEDMISIKKINQ